MRRFLRKRYIVPVIVAIILVVGFIARRGKNSVVVDNTPRVAGVSVLTASKQDEVVVPLELSGQIKGKQSTTIRSLVNGTVQSVTPVGTKVNRGTPLFRIYNESVEANYFAALNSYSNAQASAGQVESTLQSTQTQARTALDQAQTALELAKLNLENTERSTELDKQTTMDNARVSYDSAYNTVEQVMRFLGGSNVNSYIYNDKFHPSLQVFLDAQIQFVNARELFLSTPQQVGGDLIGSLRTMEQTVLEVKKLNNLTFTLLNYPPSTAAFTPALVQADLARVTGYQAQLNGADTAIKNSINGLLTIDSRSQTALDNARKQVEIAELQFKSAQETVNSQSSSAEIQRLGSRSQINAAQAQLSAAKFQYDNLALGSPFAGTIISHGIEAGSQITPGQAILEIGNLQIIEIRVEVTSNAAKALQIGETAMINGEPVGRISEIEAAADLASGKIGVIVEADNSQNQFAPGVSANVTLDLHYSVGGAIVVPLKEVKVSQTGNYVLSIENNQIIRKPVELGQVYGTLVEITSGIDEGDTIVLENGDILELGDEIQVDSSKTLEESIK